jgi:cysteine desulfurase
MDHHSTTPLDERVLDAMLPFLREAFGNASSRHHVYGWEAESAVEKAREKTAALIGAHPKEVIFTSGATESNNLAIVGTARAYKERGRHIITSKIEHKAALDSCRALEKEGFDITLLSPDGGGLITASQVEDALRPDTLLVSLMMANNEIGTLYPVKEVGELLADRKTFFHCDAVQGVGHLPVDVKTLGVDLLSISGHKIYGPKGVGALYVRRRPRVKPAPLFFGGGQERGLRPGTLNVPGIVGLGEAAALVEAEGAADGLRIGKLRDTLWQTLQSEIPELHLNGTLEERLPGNLNLSFGFVEGESLLLALNRHVAVSSGSACTSASLEPSYVLRALGMDDSLAHSSIRFGLGRFNTEEEIALVSQRVIEEVAALRALSPLWQMAEEDKKNSVG